MSFSTAASSASSKSAIPNLQAASSGHIPVLSTNTTDSSAQRRAGGSGNSGAAASSRHHFTARNNQSLRKQHKGQKRTGWADEDAIAESAAMKSINSRKGQTSITHLMNFSLPPRPYFQHHSHQNPNHRHQRRNPSWGIGSGYHANDKARYVQANYRFILLPDREYQAQAADADARLDWDAVMQILASAETQSASCPICLSIPIAPRMAKCGHIFCLPCLIRFMHSTDDSHPQPEKRARWKRCPICDDIIYVSETRPVRWFVGQEANMLREGGDVLLRLLARDSSSSLALPRDAMETLDHLDDVPWYHVAEVMDHARFMKGGEDYMTAQYDQEIFHLQELEREDELLFGEDSTWTRKAVASVSDAKDKLVGIGNPPGMVSQKPENPPPRPPIDLEPDGDVPEMYHHQRATKSGQSLSSAKASSKGHMNDSSCSSPSSSEIRTLSNKTAALGLNDPIVSSPTHDARNLIGKNIRILKTAYGSFSSFPSSLLPRVEHISTGHIVDHELRKRAKYTTHLPHGCEISFLECDWTDIISPSVLNTFGDEISRRRKKNHDKEVREERERLRAEKEEDDKRWAAARRKRPSLTDARISVDEFVPLNQERESSSLDADHDLSRTPPRTHSSFATLASPGTSPETPRTVWGTAVVSSSSPSMEPIRHEQPMDDGWLQGWERDLLEHDDSLSKDHGDMIADDNSKNPAAGGGLRKKKNKKITLMSTNARRGA